MVFQYTSHDNLPPTYKSTTHTLTPAFYCSMPSTTIPPPPPIRFVHLVNQHAHWLIFLHFRVLVRVRQSCDNERCLPRLNCLHPKNRSRVCLSPSLSLFAMLCSYSSDCERGCTHIAARMVHRMATGLWLSIPSKIICKITAIYLNQFRGSWE